MTVGTASPSAVRRSSSATVTDSDTAVLLLPHPEVDEAADRGDDRPADRREPLVEIGRVTREQRAAGELDVGRARVDVEHDLEPPPVMPREHLDVVEHPGEVEPGADDERQ